MFCKNCGKEIKTGATFCSSCGTAVMPNSSDNETSLKLNRNNSNPEVKCGNCNYIGPGETARKTVFTVLAWICVFFAPLITIIYFVGTNKYKCPKCQSTFLGIKNKDGIFVGQRGGAAKPLMIILYLFLGIATIGILSSVVLASLTTAREKGKAALAQSADWITYNSVKDNFSILFPRYPTISSDSGTNKANLTYTYNSYSSQKEKEDFLVIKYMYQNEIDTSHPDSMLESGVNAFVNGTNGNIISSNFTYSNSYRALDFYSKTADMYFKGRLILVDQSVYLIVMDYPLNDSDINYQKFINSFKIQ